MKFPTMLLLTLSWIGGLQGGNLPDQKAEMAHHLTCYGTVTIDHSKQEVQMESPRNQENLVLQGQQVHFEDTYGSIYADKITVKYDFNGQKVVPKFLVLEGNVKILNTHASVEPASPLVQYGLADKVECDLTSKEAAFSMLEQGKRVLFYDKAHDLRVSAPGLTIRRDKMTQKDVIKGSGDVRFSFVEKEIEQLRHRFPLMNLKEKIADEK